MARNLDVRLGILHAGVPNQRQESFFGLGSREAEVRGQRGYDGGGRNCPSIAVPI